MGMPVKYVGVGEKIDDLELFSPDDFVDALFAESRDLPTTLEMRFSLCVSTTTPRSAGQETDR